MAALPAVLVLLKIRTLLLVIVALPAMLALLKLRVPPLLVRLGANAELLTMPVPLILKTTPPIAKEYAGAPELNWIVLIEAPLVIVTDVGAPLLVNVAVLSGKVGLELQLVPVVHSAPGPVQVPSTACAASGASAASAPNQTLASSAIARRRTLTPALSRQAAPPARPDAPPSIALVRIHPRRRVTRRRSAVAPARIAWLKWFSAGNLMAWRCCRQSDERSSLRVRAHLSCPVSGTPRSTIKQLYFCSKRAASVELA
jgi:hypothetical protein